MPLSEAGARAGRGDIPRENALLLDLLFLKLFASSMFPTYDAIGVDCGVGKRAG